MNESNAKLDDNQYSEASYEPATINTIHEPFGREITFNGNGVRPETGKLDYVQGLHKEIRKSDSMRVTANISSAKFDDNQNMISSCNVVKHNMANAFNREFISTGNVSEFLSANFHFVKVFDLKKSPGKINYVQSLFLVFFQLIQLSFTPDIGSLFISHGLVLSMCRTFCCEFSIFRCSSIFRI